MPSLETIGCSDISELVPLLDAFEGSTELDTIYLPLNHQSPCRVGSLKLALRQLSLSFLRSRIRLHLHAELIGRRRWEAIDDEERRILGCLYNVERVRLTPSASQMYSYLSRGWPCFLVPWLVELEFILWSKLKEASNRNLTMIALLEEARLAMPWIPHISYV
ncbi:hypothetical protein C8R44DRAFT_869385 [Mycena epipterygia]|nr:hypothetical protein C8R44DRAFT_869385 [Mycena epipterygia]